MPLIGKKYKNDTKVISFLLIILIFLFLNNIKIGLFVVGIIGLVFYFVKKHNTNSSESSQEENDDKPV